MRSAIELGLHCVPKAIGSVSLARPSGSSFGILEQYLFAQPPDMLAGKGGHYLAINILLILRSSGFCQVDEIVETDILVVDDVARIESSFDFVDAVLQGISATESQTFLDLVEIYTIIPSIRILDIFHGGPRDNTLDSGSHLGESKIQTVVANVEDLPADNTEWGIENKDHGFGEVLHVDKGPPLVSIINCDHTVLTCLGSEKVDHEVEPRTARQSEDSREAQQDRMEIVIGGFKEGPL